MDNNFFAGNEITDGYLIGIEEVHALGKSIPIHYFSEQGSFFTQTLG